ncbi:solute carrier family 22 member 5-like protein [Leptotrombidium deliense]|uniref:Solute carrier family 22 member 5-like protein n=1 Tax=Leptotrombidium deliense TaxID=299467 RepID=A0A443S7D3_9ACAR|nr:solute carrier family 22 member 5-like protein [Leptotrombidium deliense]
MRKFSRASICLPRITTKFTLDDIFEKYIGKFGKFQKLLTVYIFIIVAPLVGFNMTTNFLILLEPPHLCDRPKSAQNNTASENSNSSSLCGANLNVDGTSIKLQHVSLDCNNTRNDWVCENNWKAKLVHVAYRAGSFCGMLVIGVLSDRYGRIPTTIFCFSIAGIAGLSTIFAANNYVFFLICRAFMGFVSFKGTVPVVLGGSTIL